MFFNTVSPLCQVFSLFLLNGIKKQMWRVIKFSMNKLFAGSKISVVSTCEQQQMTFIANSCNSYTWVQ